LLLFEVKTRAAELGQGPSQGGVGWVRRFLLLLGPVEHDEGILARHWIFGAIGEQRTRYSTGSAEKGCDDGSRNAGGRPN
jgi:hypothetical protein